MRAATLQGFACAQVAVNSCAHFGIWRGQMSIIISLHASAAARCVESTNDHSELSRLFRDNKRPLMRSGEIHPPLPPVSPTESERVQQRQRRGESPRCDATRPPGGGKAVRAKRVAAGKQDGWPSRGKHNPLRLSVGGRRVFWTFSAQFSTFARMVVDRPQQLKALVVC